MLPRQNENLSKCNQVHLYKHDSISISFRCDKPQFIDDEYTIMLKSFSTQTDDKAPMHGSWTFCEVPAIQCVNQYGLLISPPPSTSSVSAWCWQWDGLHSTYCTVFVFLFPLPIFPEYPFVLLMFPCPLPYFLSPLFSIVILLTQASFIPPSLATPTRQTLPGS